MGTNPRIQPIERATKRTWDQWLQFMDTIDASKLDHHQIATQVLEVLGSEIDSPAWWAQSVTVAYEQHIGRRIPGQRPDGTFQTSVSKSTGRAMEALMDAWVEFAAHDEGILSLIAGAVRVSGTDKRITWRTKAHDGSDIRVTSEPKKNGAASIIAVQMGLLTSERNDATKARWSAILQRFVDGL